MFSSNFQTKDSLQNGVPASDSRMFGQAPLSTKWRWPASWSGMLGARKTRRQTLAHIKWPFYTGAGASHSVGEISRGMYYILKRILSDTYCIYFFHPIWGASPFWLYQPTNDEQNNQTNEGTNAVERRLRRRGLFLGSKLGGSTNFSIRWSASFCRLGEDDIRNTSVTENGRMVGWIGWIGWLNFVWKFCGCVAESFFWLLPKKWWFRSQGNCCWKGVDFVCCCFCFCYLLVAEKRFCLSNSSQFFEVKETRPFFQKSSFKRWHIQILRNSDWKIQKLVDTSRL